MNAVADLGHRAVEGTRSLLLSFGLLVLRVGIGGLMIYAHGWGKLAGFSAYADKFADPFGFGKTPSLALAVFAEVGCSALLIVGLATRLAAIPLACTMLVAGFMIHAADPWQKKELAFVYLVPYLALIFTGPGRFSLDALFAGRRRSKPKT